MNYDIEAYKVLQGHAGSIAIQRAMRFLNKDFKRDYNLNAAYLMGIGLRDISGWYELPWKVRQRKLSGTKGRFLPIEASDRQVRRANESRAGKKNRMTAWRSRICYRGIYEPRQP